MNKVNINAGGTTLTVTLIMISVLLYGCGSLGLGETSGTSKPISLGTGGRPTPLGGGTADANIASVQWQEQFGFVRIERAEKTAGSNDHPASFSADQIRSMLSQLQVEMKAGSAETLFDSEELDDISHPIALALTKAGPDEDVTFAVAGQKGPITLIKQRLLTTGRIFYKDGRVNVIFGLVHTEFVDQYRATGILRDFTPGTRSGRIESRWNILSRDPAMTYALGRKDWVQLSSEASSAVAGRAEPSAGPEAAPLPAQREPAPSRWIKPDYPDLEERLEVLKRLRGRDLITEEEYQRKRRAILDQL